MARLTKRIQQKMQKQAPSPEPVKKRKKNPGQDIMLILLIALIVFVLYISWDVFSNEEIFMYITLGLSMICTYIKQKMDLSRKVEVFISRLNISCMAVAMILFLYIGYVKFVA